MNAIVSVMKAMDTSSFRVRSGVFSGLGLRHAVLALAFALGYTVFGQLGLLGSGELSVMVRLKSFSQMPLHLAVACLAILAAVAADNTLGSGAARWLRYPTAVLVAAAAGGALIVGDAPAVDLRDAKVLFVLSQVPDIRLFLMAKGFLVALYICTVVVVLYVVIETNHRVSLALHAARMRTLVEQRDVSAAELTAMQARVDPELLFESLRRVDKAYATDAGQGQDRLDALIRFLRAALPGKSSKNSTVRLEIELVEAYVALVAPDCGSRRQASFLVSPVLLDEFVPPMILLPLVRWALAGATADGLSISVDRNGATASLSLNVGNRGPGVTGSGDAEVQVIKDRLQRLYGNAVRVEITTADNLRLAVVELPTGATWDSGSPVC